MVESCQAAQNVRFASRAPLSLTRIASLSSYAEWQVLKTPEGLTYYYNTYRRLVLSFRLWLIASFVTARSKTNITTWDKPDALKTEDELASSVCRFSFCCLPLTLLTLLPTQGDWVWMPDEKESFIPARIVGRSGAQVQLQTEQGQQVCVLSLALQYRIPPVLSATSSCQTRIDRLPCCPPLCR